MITIERLIDHINARILSFQNVYETTTNEYEKTAALNIMIELAKLLDRIEE